MNFSPAWSQAAWTQLWQLTAVIVVVAAATTLCRRRPHLAPVAEDWVSPLGGGPLFG